MLFSHFISYESKWETSVPVASLSVQITSVPVVSLSLQKTLVADAAFSLPARRKLKLVTLLSLIFWDF